MVAAAIYDREERVLLQQCPPNKRHAGKWEFPGGKVDPFELPRFALCREVREELSLELDISTIVPAGFADEAPAEGQSGLVLMLYSSHHWVGVPQGLEGQNWNWFDLAEAGSLDMPGMDQALLAGLVRARSG
ncbi:MAG: NUDIX domain-containing protein [Croceibacterium sp.]